MFDLESFVKELSTFLSGWVYRIPEIGTTRYWHHLDGPGGASLSFHYAEPGKRIVISPNYIRHGSSQYPASYRNDPPLVGSITVSETRTPESAAKDIKRRVIEGYLPLYEKGKKEVADIEAYESKKAAIALEFATILNDDRHREGSDTVSRYVYKPGFEYGISLKATCFVEIRVNSEDVELKLGSCPVDIAKKILALFPKLPLGQATV
jgi:hypothetical protein